MSKLVSGLLSNLRNTMILSSIITLVVVIGYMQHAGGVDATFVQAVLRFVHLVFGIMWIGLLYYFHYVQVPAFAAYGSDLIASFIALVSVRAAVSTLDVQDGRVRLGFAAVRFDALVGLLDALAKSEGLRAVDATLTARVEAGTVRADVTLAR